MVALEALVTEVGLPDRDTGRAHVLGGNRHVDLSIVGRCSSQAGDQLQFALEAGHFGEFVFRQTTDVFPFAPSNGVVDGSCWQALDIHGYRLQLVGLLLTLQL